MLKSLLRKLLNEPTTPVEQPKVEEPAVEQPKVEKQPRKPRKKKVVEQPKSEKDIATERGEPWVNVTRIDLNGDNPNVGDVTLDFNDVFVARLIKAGYTGATEYDIVGQWFAQITRSIAEDIDGGNSR